MTIYTHTGLSAPNNTSDTTFQKWASLADAMILACGWVQTADTGQSDPATATVPGTNSTAAGYRVYSLNDALAGVAPVLLKYEWGRGGGVTTPAAWFTIGRASDGAGALSGLLLARSQTFTTSAAGGAGEVASWASGDGSSLNLTMWPTAANSFGWTLRIERSRTLTGEPTGDGLAITVASQGTSITRTIAYGGTIDSVGDARGQGQLVHLPEYVNSVLSTPSASPAPSFAISDVAPVLPVVHVAPGVTPWVSANLVAIAAGDAGLSSLVIANTHGTPRTFRTHPQVTQAAPCDVRRSGTAGGVANQCAITAQVWAD